MNFTTKTHNFLIVAVICCFLSVITTLGIHSSLFDLGEMDFQQRLALPDNPVYLLKRFWIILHCLFVLISMWGFCILQFRKSPGFTGLGFVFFAVFAFTEIFRQMFILFYLSNLRRAYTGAEVAEQEVIRVSMDHAGLVGYALFGLFIVAFALGNIFYGIGLYNRNATDRVLAILLVLWGAGNLLAFSNEFWHNESLGTFVEFFNIIYQPLMRILIAFWLLFRLRQLQFE